MHLRKLVLACGFASFALSNYASALGLGEVKLKSTLNQPLSAEVKLLDTQGLTSEQIIVSLASVGDFDRNGLDYVHFYSELKFEVALDGPAGPVVRITSRNPVREPYLNFLVEAKWTSGRLLREYTLLMDLPTFDDAAPQAVQSAQATVTQSPKSSPVKNVVPANIDADVRTSVETANLEEKPDIIAEQDQPAKKPNVAADTYGPVGDRDTLWDIALSVRPDSSASVHQTMLALQRLNPDAFIRGNINLLKKGQVLRVPDAAEISSVSRSEAVSQFSAQTAEWSGSSTNDSGLGAQLDASSRSSNERVKSEAVAGRVKLEAPTAKNKSSSGQGSGSNKGSGKALESELVSTLEELDKAKSDKVELSSRVRDLEAQVKTMQRLVDVSNEKLRALQLNSAQLPEKTEKPVEAAVSAPVTGESSSATAVSSAAAVVPKKPVVKLASKVVEPEKSLVDQLFDNILWVGLGAAGILGAAGLVVMRRRKSQAEAAETFDKDSGDLFTSEPNFDAFNQPDEPTEEPAIDEMALFDEDDASTVAETGDVVGEADIYIAYGKYDQAEEMLLNGLSKDPASTDIRLKLLEVYSQMQNSAEFDKHYAAILPLATGFALSRAKELRANIADIGEFSSELQVSSSTEDSLDFNADFDLDDFDTEPAEAVVADRQNNEDFDFDLDFDDAEAGLDLDVPATTNYGMDFNAKVDAKESAVASASDEFTLDFDLNSATKNSDSSAEDLSEISFALDGLDDDGLPEDIEVSSRDDEYSFDFNNLENDVSRLAQEVGSIKSSEFNEDSALGDDFNLDMDVNNLDLAALDSEMANLDAELEMLESDPPVKPSFLAEDEAASESLEDFDFESLDDDLAALDTNLQDEALTELEETLDTDLDDADFSWESTESSEAEAELELASAIEDEFSLSDDEFAVEDDEFDIDADTDLEVAASLQDLDAALTEESLDEQLSLDDELAVDEIEDTLFESEVLDAVVDAESVEVASDEPVPLLKAAEEELGDDDIFEQALSDFSAESLAIDEEANMSDDDMDAELDFMADADEAATKLDLARAYMDMGDSEGARDILAEVAHEGNEQQRQEAVDLLDRLDA